jgi:cytochrome c553
MGQLINQNKTRMKTLCILAGSLLVIAYFAGSNAWAESSPAGKDPAVKDDVKQPAAVDAANKPASVPFEAEFAKVAEKCAKCHEKKFSSTENLIKNKWIVPGKPENSPIYKVIGKHKKPNGAYHNLTDAEKAAVNDYIKNLK